MGIVKNFQQRSLPDSISILINFGTEKDHILYDADSTNHECGTGQIWDPFSRACRDIFCSTDQVLEQFTCSGGNSSTSGGEKDLEKLTLFPDFFQTTGCPSPPRTSSSI